MIDYLELDGPSASGLGAGDALIVAVADYTGRGQGVRRQRRSPASHGRSSCSARRAATAGVGDAFKNGVDDIVALPSESDSARDPAAHASSSCSRSRRRSCASADVDAPKQQQLSQRDLRARAQGRQRQDADRRPTWPWRWPTTGHSVALHRPRPAVRRHGAGDGAYAGADDLRPRPLRRLARRRQARGLPGRAPVRRPRAAGPGPARPGRDDHRAVPRPRSSGCWPRCTSSS